MWIPLITKTAWEPGNEANVYYLSETTYYFALTSEVRFLCTGSVCSLTQLNVVNGGSQSAAGAKCAHAHAQWDARPMGHDACAVGCRPRGVVS